MSAPSRAGRSRAGRAALALPLLLGACAAAAPLALSSPEAGFATVSARAAKATGARTAWTQTQAQSAAVSAEVHALTHNRQIGADTAVQVALLNNKALQAAYAEVGLSAAEVWQQATPTNPVVAVGLFGIGAPELGLYRALESVIAVNLLDARTRGRRVALAEARLQEAQLAAVAETLALATETRRAWVEAVAAFEAASLLRQAAATADASSELAAELGRTGALNKAGQAREQAFAAELAGQVARARLDAALAKERLTRLMGLWGSEVAYTVPDALPALPRTPQVPASVERAALANRVDLEVARLGLEASARAFGLTDATRLVTDLDLVVGIEAEREEEPEDGEVETAVTPQVEVDFTIPIYDSGRPRLRAAELSYLRAANVLASRAVEVRSEARAAEVAARATHRIALHYRDVVLPLRAAIEEEALLSYSGMITNTFELLTDTRERLGSNIEAAAAKRDYWLAAANLTAAIYGGGAAAEAGGGDAALADAGGAEH